MLREADWDAAVIIGGQHNHILAIFDS